MKPRKRGSLSGLIVVELVSGRDVIVSPGEMRRSATVRRRSFFCCPLIVS